MGVWDVEGSIWLLVTFLGCRYLSVGLWEAVLGRSWLAGNNSVRMGLESCECEGELARRLLMALGEPDR